MSDRRTHIAQAEHNITVATDLKDRNLDLYKDWIVTICFYACVHYAEAAFDSIPGVQGTELTCPANTSKHRYREDLLRKYYPAVVTDYVALLNLSQTTRYVCGNWISAKSAKDALKVATSMKSRLGLGTP